MAKLNLSSLRSQILNALDAPPPVSHSSQSQFAAMSHPKRTAETIPAVERLRAITQIQDYLIQIFEKQPNSYFSMMLSARRMIPYRESVELDQIAIKEAEFTAEILGAMRVGLQQLGQYTEERTLAWKYFNQTLLVDYLIDMVVLPCAHPNLLTHSRSDLSELTQSLLSHLSKDQESEMLLLATDPNFLQRLIQRDAFAGHSSDSRTPHVKFKKRSSTTQTPKKPEQKKNDTPTSVSLETAELQAEYVGTIDTNCYRLSQETYISTVEDIYGRTLDKQKSQIAFTEPPEILDSNQAKVTIPVSSLTYDSDFGYKLPCPRGATITAVDCNGALFRSEFNTYSFTPDTTSEPHITYVVTLDAESSKSIFHRPEETPLFPFSRLETFHCDEFVGRTSSDKAKTGLILSTARMLQPVYSIEAWVDAIIEASGSRRHLALEALQIFKCDTASQYLGMRFQQHDIPCHIIAGICASPEKRAFNVATGHSELEYQAQESTFRLSSGDITQTGCRIPSGSVDIAKVKELVADLPNLDDETLFSRILEFQASLPRDQYDHEQTEREQRAFGRGAHYFEREEQTEYTPENYTLLMEIINEEMALAEQGLLSQTEFKVLLKHLVQYQNQFRYKTGETDEFLKGTYGDPLPKEVEAMHGYDKKSFYPNYVSSVLELFKKTINNPGYESSIVEFVRPSLFPDEQYQSRRLQIHLYDTFTLLGVDRIAYFPTDQKLTIAYSALLNTGRHHSHKGGEHSALIDRYTNDIFDLVSRTEPHDSYWHPPRSRIQRSALHEIADQSIYLEHRDDLRTKIAAYCQIIEKSGMPAHRFIDEIFVHESHFSHQLPELFNLIREYGLFREHILPNNGVSEELNAILQQRLSQRISQTTGGQPTLGITLSQLKTFERCGFSIQTILPFSTIAGHLHKYSVQDALALQFLLNLPADASLADQRIGISEILSLDPARIEQIVILGHILRSYSQGEKQMSLELLATALGHHHIEDSTLPLPSLLFMQYPPEKRREIFHQLRLDMKNIHSKEHSSEVPNDIQQAIALLFEVMSTTKIHVSRPDNFTEFVGFMNSRYNPIHRGIYNYKGSLVFLRDGHESTLDYGRLSDNFPSTAVHELMEYGLKLGKYEKAKIYTGTLKVGSRETSAGEIYRKSDGMEFHSTREYQHGDSIRRINWAATARAGRHITNVFYEIEPEQADLTIALDTYIEGQSELIHDIKSKFIINWSQSVGWLSKHQNSLKVTYTLKGAPIIQGELSQEHFTDHEKLLVHLEELLFMADQIADTDHRLMCLGIRYT